MIRVLIVDDSVVVRKVVTRAFEREPEIEVVGAAASGAEAIAMLEPLKPDAVILDLEMPGMSGLETLAAIRKTHRSLPVIVFSYLTARGASATIEALTRGATDFALKPQANGAGLADDYVRSQLLPLLISLSTPSVLGRESVSEGGPRSLNAAIKVIVIAASTGGPAALATVIGGLPPDLSVPVLVVQHLPANFTRLLAERLDRESPASVIEARDGDQVLPGRVYIAPGGQHMTIAGSEQTAMITVNDGPRENSCRPSADVLFRGAAEAYGPGVLAVVLTGIGRDGTEGSRAVWNAGGTVFVEDEASCVAPGMPASVVSAGLADAVVPLGLIAGSIKRRLVVGSPK